MKCPHCSEKVHLFSREMREIARTKTCPLCGKPVKFGLIHSRFAVAFIPIALASIVLGLGGPFAAGFAGGMGAAFGFGLKSADA
ncbi:MAG: hypothetical protein JWQ76_737 [Ramlibacter sp.]|nr:hypothetical protein [Ramlibacter sp.]